MTLGQEKKLAEHIMRLVKVRQVSFPLCVTERGPLSMKYIKDQEHPEIVLDAVPLDLNEFNHKELKRLLEGYLYEKEPVQVNAMGNNPTPLGNKPTNEFLNGSLNPPSLMFGGVPTSGTFEKQPEGEEDVRPVGLVKDSLPEAAVEINQLEVHEAIDKIVENPPNLHASN